MENKKIEKILVANRGEIAIRVFRACYELDIRSVGIYSEADAFNLFRTKADESYLIGKDKTPLGAYLDIEGIIKLAKAKKVDAIHPGYGFLSENAGFAAACEKAGIIFIGPPSSVLSKMGDKLNAKEIAKKCNVPTIPGGEAPLKNAEEAAKKAKEYGYPVILKAAAGGGGKGMRRVENEEELKVAFPLVQSEAKKSFGSGDIFIEKFLVNPKHIEIQVLADKHGTVVHLHERDCSLQRRYQKVIEVAPAVSLPEKTRQALFSDAIKIAKSVGYVSAGTVEFLVDQSGDYYFIEMNPRIQVEHTISEVVTGIDIVQAQIRIAQGYKLSSEEIGIKSQSDIVPRGFAIQCRITTEDPKNNFSPDVGKITVYRSPGGLGVRLDAGNAMTGAEISPYYDSLLVKITTFDRTYHGAIRKALRAVKELRVRGVKTNSEFITNILKHPKFQADKCHTLFIDETKELYDFAPPQDRATKILKYLAEVIVNDKSKIKAKIEKLPELVVPNKPRDGLKQLLDTKGPKAFADHCLKEKKLLLSDTTLRDAHQSLLATRVRSKDMIAAADFMAATQDKFFALEMWGGATFDVAFRFLHECPWERLRNLRKKIPNIPFMMLLRGANAVGYTSYPDNVVKEFIRVAAKEGIDIFRVFDSLNWLPNMELSIEEVIKQGKVCEGYICYTGDIEDPKRDKYPLTYYVKMAKELEKRGVHILGIKDMSGLLKPYAAYKLVKTLKQEIGLPIHLHTHDTTGNGVAMALKAAEAECDIIDTAIASLSSLTSQPSMNAVIAAMKGQQRDTGIEDESLWPLVDYWSAVRGQYTKFEEGLTSPSTEIYKYEIPGGQYSNLKPQVESLGLGDRFKEVKEKYAEVNNMLGEIVKVTPSSKMVGDMAIFMVQNNLTAENIIKRGANLNYPDSVVSYFGGYMGQPQGGFNKELQKIVLKGKKPITTRPGENLKPADFKKTKKEMEEFTVAEPSEAAVVSYLLYPKVVKDFNLHQKEYGDLSNLDTAIFFNGLAVGESTEVAIEDGKTLYIKLVSISKADENGYKTVNFELNGSARSVQVLDTSIENSGAKVRLADLEKINEIGAPIPGMVSKILVKRGDTVSKNQVLAVIEAMKMETTVMSRTAGTIEEVLVAERDKVAVGELLIVLG